MLSKYKQLAPQTHTKCTQYIQMIFHSIRNRLPSPQRETCSPNCNSINEVKILISPENSNIENASARSGR